VSSPFYFDTDFTMISYLFCLLQYGTLCALLAIFFWEVLGSRFVCPQYTTHAQNINTQNIHLFLLMQTQKGSRGPQNEIHERIRQIYFNNLVCFMSFGVKLFANRNTCFLQMKAYQHFYISGRCVFVMSKSLHFEKQPLQEQDFMYNVFLAFVLLKISRCTACFKGTVSWVWSSQRLVFMNRP